MNLISERCEPCGEAAQSSGMFVNILPANYHLGVPLATFMYFLFFWEAFLNDGIAL